MAGSDPPLQGEGDRRRRWRGPRRRRHSRYFAPRPPDRQAHPAQRPGTSERPASPATHRVRHRAQVRRRENGPPRRSRPPAFARRRKSRGRSAPPDAGDGTSTLPAAFAVRATAGLRAASSTGAAVWRGFASVSGRGAWGVYPSTGFAGPPPLKGEDWGCAASSSSRATRRVVRRLAATPAVASGSTSFS